MNSLKYALCLSCFVYTAHSNAQDVGQVGTDVGGTVGSFGGIGLLEMRNARFSNDGDLSVGMGILSDGQNYYATWQATPWLETTLRYSDYNNALDGVDKGLDVKLRLLEEGKYKPAIAIGLQDMLGDGVFSGEYIVASKRINNFDFTMGLGFGKLSGRATIGNMFKAFGDTFSKRSFTNDNSEKLRLGNYFSGDKMGYFWGVEYNTPLKGLTAKVEYSTVKKSDIKIFENYNSKTAFNFGINYKINNWLEAGAGFMHGNQFAFHLTLTQNLHKPSRLIYAKGPEVDEIRVRQLKNKAKNTQDYKTSEDEDYIFERLNQMGFNITSLNLMKDYMEISLEPMERQITDREIVLGSILESYADVYLNFANNPLDTIHVTRSDEKGKMALSKYRNSEYFAREGEELSNSGERLISKSIFDKMSLRKLKPSRVEFLENEIIVEKNVSPFSEIPKNVGRTARILTNEAPDNIERFTIISKERGTNVSKVSVLRKDFEKTANYTSSPEEIYASAIIDEPIQEYKNGTSFERLPTFEYGILPDVVSHFGSDKDDHFKADLNLKIYAKVNIAEGLQLNAQAKQHLIGNLDLIPVSNNPNVPHVRSDVGLYASEGTSSISRLNLEYIKNPTKNVYTKITAGFLEEMYSGVSGEVLYRPYDSNFALGIDVNFVKQRGYDQLFDMREYKTVTGHATLYHVNKKYDITSKISAGRYLAKDWGTTIDISRQFKNGIKIGAIATFTNMSQSDFGRGSFDKGIYMTVPFDFFWFKQSREKAKFRFKRLGKNGGQKIEHQTNLFEMLSAGQTKSLENNWNKILE
ncbi:MAG: hypothetical protein HOH19_13695 [Kordiimonadaceae bacterium]|jgi:hypothetical protein|nr:hypothetical protein [Kordiimonadaceae bacterium]MBT6033625.1 hypothetical protein [Kordiimonadaceae bacterium]